MLLSQTPLPFRSSKGSPLSCVPLRFVSVKGSKPLPLPPWVLGVAVVVGSVGVVDVIPDLGHARIGPHDHAVAGTADRVALVRELDLSLRRLGVVVEGLLKSVVDRGAPGAIEEGARAQDVEAFAQARSGSRRNHRADKTRRGRGVEMRGLKGRHHVHLALDFRGAGGELARLKSFVDRDLVFDRAAGARDGRVWPTNCRRRSYSAA